MCLPVDTCNYMYNLLFHTHLSVSNPVDTAKVLGGEYQKQKIRVRTLDNYNIFWIFGPDYLFPALPLPLGDNTHGFFLPGNVDVRRIAIHLVLA